MAPGLVRARTLKSTVDDMLGYVGAHLDPDRTTLAGSLRRVQSPRFRVNKHLAIGLAWLVVDRNHQTLVWHNGGTGGFSSVAGFSPTASVALVGLAIARVAGQLTRVCLRELHALATEGRA